MLEMNVCYEVHVLKSSIKLRYFHHITRGRMYYYIQCPLDKATLDIAAALAIATSTPMELGALALHK